MPRIDTRRTRSQPPTLEYILGLKAEYEQRSGPVHARWEAIRKVRDGTYIVEIPEKYRKTTKQVKTRRVGDVLRRVVATVTKNFPSFQVPPQGQGPAAQENSTLREKWLNASFAELDVEEAPERVFVAGMDHACTYGLGVWKLLPRKDLWWDMPTARRVYKRPATDLSPEEWQSLQDRREDYKKGKLPFTWLAVDPFTVWFFRRGRQMAEVIEVTERLVSDLVGRYSVHWDGEKMEPGEVGDAYQEGEGPASGDRRVTFVEHWSDEYVTYATESMILAQWKHGYGRPPYFPFLGLANYSAVPGYRGESAVEHVYHLEMELDSLLTMKHNYIHMAAYPMGFVKLDAQSPMLAGPEATGEGQTGPDFEYESGVFKVLPPGAEPGWLEPPATGRDLNDGIAFFNGMLSQTIPDVLKGIADGGSGESGYRLNQRIVAARQVFDPITDNAARAMEQMAQFKQWSIQYQIKEPVYVLGEPPQQGEIRKWLRLRPEDINDYLAVTCQIKADLPSNRIAEGQFGASMVQAGLIPKRQAREEFLGIPNPEEISDEIRVERMLEDPQSVLSQWVDKEAIKKAELDHTLKREQRKAALAALQVPAALQFWFQLVNGQSGGALAPPPGPEMGGLVPAQAMGPSQGFGVPGPEGLAPTPGQGMALGSPMPAGAANGMDLIPGGRAAGQGIQPNTTTRPGGIPGE